MRIANRIASLLIFILGIYIAVVSSKFDFMTDGTPGPGFLPFLTGLCIAIVAIIPFVKTFTQFASKLENPFAKGEFKEFFIVIGSSIMVMLVTPVTGLLIALGLMVGTISKLMGTKSWKTVISLAILTPIVLFGIFDVILDVPLPKGYFGF